MVRAFVAIALPDDVRFELMLLQQGLSTVRLVKPENLHLTLTFLGELAEPDLEEAHRAIEQIKTPGFELSLQGLGIFGGRKPRVVYVGADGGEALPRLQAKVENAVRSAGLTIERRKFTPHVTIARIDPGRADRAQLERFVAARAGFSVPAFRVESFGLYRSTLRPEGPSYEELARYPLR